MSTFESPLDNPEVQAAAAAVLEDPLPERPTVPTPWPSDVTTPGGRHVRLRELNGLHEERLSKVTGDNIGRWIQTLLECGVESIDGAESVSNALRLMTIGDREFLVMAVRRVTYGDEVEVGTVQCPKCGEAYDVTINLSTDLEIRPLTVPEKFSVDLSRGRKAHVHIPNGNDQIAYFENPDATEAERKSVMLAQCIEAIEEADGEIQAVAGMGSIVRSLSIPDRNKILTALTEAQPGPRYNELSYEHDCGHKQPLFVGLMHLFPGL